MHEARSRALGALYGLALGDALGMPTQSLPRAEIVARYGTVVGGFRPGPDGHPLAAGLPAGSVTDDTEQAVLLARLVVAGHGDVDAAALARDLLAWEESMRARGSLDLLGPSTRQALAALAAGGDAAEAGRHGVTNGAAMRVTPVGVATSSREPRLLEDRVVAASRLTHNTGVALAGAAAVAAAVSAGIDGDPLPAAISRAVAAAASAAGRGHWTAGADVAARINWATALVAGLPQQQVLDTVYRLVGTSLATQESVPAAFAVAAAVPGDPWLACRLAASLGGDCDTIAAMTGAICGACHGAGAFPAAARDRVARVNGLDFGLLADDLLAIRGPAHG
ncbi:MAG TPA: ADP-ribosylglycohydrolase family protein [Streptosporangiaceae bacterium]|nr:ADP-ribosylglycohydrolase family protein [Streptosporangiaceae bacterium]